MNSQSTHSAAGANSSPPASDNDRGGGSNRDKNQPKNEANSSTVILSTVASPSSATKSRIVEELKPEDVRWFFKTTAKDKSWQPLNGQDSLAIERAYRRGLSETKILEETKKKRRDSESSNDSQKSDAVPPVPQNVVALGGLYRLFHACEIATPSSDTAAVPPPKTCVLVDPQCDIKEKKHGYKLIPAYWEGTGYLLTRGTWFYSDWQPLDADSAELAEKIEKQHLKTFAGQRVPDQPVCFEKGVRPTLCEVADADEEKCAGTGVRVRWHSPVDVYLINNKGSRLFRYLKFQGSGTKLMRGYLTEAKIEDGPAPVTDLVFVMHGIGQKRKQNGILVNTSTVREIAEQQFKTYYAGIARRPMFVPIDWRSELILDEDAIHNITPMHILKLRNFFNESLLDLMYYTSPLYHSEILQETCMALNRVYKLFLQNDPTFESRGGKVSFMAHSLGSVIAYDLLTGYMGPDMIREMRETSSSLKTAIRLHFKTDHLFCFGSPLGVFLAVRGLRGPKILEAVKDEHDDNSAEPASFKLHNIYHPTDPVAYRIEPLVSEIYTQVRPLTIQAYSSSKWVPYESMPAEQLERRPMKLRIASRSMSPGTSSNDLKRSRHKSEDSEESLDASGFDSDEGGATSSKEVAKQDASPSPKPISRSWSTAVFERFGMGKTTGKDGGPRAGSPEPGPSGAVAVEEVQDAEKKVEPEKAAAVAIIAVSASIEQISVAQSISPKQAAATEKPEPKPNEESPKKEFVIPPGQALPYRIDFTLRQSRMEIQYWAALFSHVSYWKDHDAIMYVLSSLYGQPNLPSSPSK